MMEKEYLSGDVKEFAAWFGRQLASDALTHGYNIPGGKSRFFSGLEDAFKGYSWRFSVKLPDEQDERKGHTFQELGSVLARLRTGLTDALSMPAGSVRDRKVCEWSIAVMNWSHLRAFNALWLEQNRSHLVAEIQATAAILIHGDDNLEQLFSGIRRFNVGMSKLYSLLVPVLVAYDSRVAAALTWFVAKWCIDTERKRVPADLTFPCMRALEDFYTVIRKNRNPSQHGLKFPPLRDAAVHAHWNLRASWVLKAALARARKSLFSDERNPLRALEAALFMWGYNLDPVPASRHDQTAIEQRILPSTSRVYATRSWHSAHS